MMSWAHARPHALHRHDDLGRSFIVASLSPRARDDGQRARAHIYHEPGGSVKLPLQISIICKPFQHDHWVIDVHRDRFNPCGCFKRQGYSKAAMPVRILSTLTLI
jgi:hypothetical protein